MTDFAKQVADAKELAAAVNEAQGKGKKIVVEPVSCDFTKENFAAKPDLSAPGADDVPEEEFCDNCGRVMVLRNGPWGPFMACPGYNEDPPCKTIRKLTQKVQTKPPVQLEEGCPKCGKPLLQRDGQYGEFIACSGYPKCKYVKQDLLDVKCPKDGGDLAVRKTKRGDVFYGCVNYPKCDFASNLKLVNQTCPQCDSAYLLEVVNDKGTFLVCPNNQEALPKRRAKKGAKEEAPTTPPCSYETQVAGPAAVVAPIARTRRRRGRWWRAWPKALPEDVTKDVQARVVDPRLLPLSPPFCYKCAIGIGVQNPGGECRKLVAVAVTY